MYKRVFLATLLFSALTLSVSAQNAEKREITYQDISQQKFASQSISGLHPMNDGEHYSAKRGQAVVRYSYQSGQAVDTLFDASKCTPLLKFDSYTLSQDESVILLATQTESIYRHSSKAAYWIYDCVSGSLKPLSKHDKQQEATISPDGRKAAFVRDNNLYIVDLSSGQEKQITSDGVKGQIINGIPDWVYEEEYGFSRAYHWSPSSDAIAFYRFDEKDVKSYSMDVFKNELYPQCASFKYPKAGETNSIVQIKVYRVNTGVTTDVDLGSETDQYIPHIEWTGRASELAIHRLNRLQNKYELLFANSILGASRVIYTEISPRYIERIDDNKVKFLADGKRFIIKNETSGWMHLYLYDMNGKMLNRITQGDWEVTSLDGIDNKNGLIYYTSTEESPLRRNLYRIRLNGRNKDRMTMRDGFYSTSFSKECKYYISTFSNAETPPVITLHRADGRLVRSLEENTRLQQNIAEYHMPSKEFFTFKNPQGVVLNGYILKPHDFDSTKSYPLFMTQYSGPGSQQVADRWGLSWESALLKEGIIVACVDGRGTGFRGEEFRKCTYGKLGELEYLDQAAAAEYLGSLPFIDKSRIAIYGWSYGGFMALNCILKGADIFAMAVAVAPVTSWRYYDTIYTEIYNGLPQQNPQGYDDNSPINYADRLKGKLLICHGTADDNVHIQNTYEMINRLIKADKDFDMLIYPDKNHSMGSSRDNLINKIIRFTTENI